MASSNLPSQVGIRDKEGFDDVDNYFSPQKEAELLSDWKVTKTPSKFSNQDKENLENCKEYEEYTLPLHQDDNDYETLNNIENAEIDDENEISFGSKVIASPDSSASHVIATKANRKSREQKLSRVKQSLISQASLNGSESECIITSYTCR